MKKLIAAFAVVLVVLMASPSCMAGTQTASGLTVADLISRIKEDVNDDSGNFFTDAEAMRWASEAVAFMASQGRCLEATENATLYQGQMAYPLSTAHYDVETVLYDNGDASSANRYVTLNKVDPKELFPLSKEAGRPTYWWEWGGSIYLWPMPGADQNGTTIQTFLIEAPTAFSATTDAVPTPYYLDPLILLYMKAKFYAKDDKHQTAAYYLQLFTTEFATYRQEVRKNLVPEAK